MGTTHSYTCIGIHRQITSLSDLGVKQPTLLFLHLLFSAQLAFIYNVDLLTELLLRSNTNLNCSVQSKMKMLLKTLTKTWHLTNPEYGSQCIKFEIIYTEN